MKGSIPSKRRAASTCSASFVTVFARSRETIMKINSATFCAFALSTAPLCTQVRAQPLPAAPLPAWNVAPPVVGALLCVNGECDAAITQEEFMGRKAFRLSDTASEAIVVPELGRVMSYGLVGGPNVLYVDEKMQPKTNQWANFGGSKTWPAPQNEWATWQKSGGWPPPHEIDGAPHQYEVLSGGKLKTISPIHPGSGLRAIRVYSFNEKGEFVIEQTLEKWRGGAARHSIWSVTQIATPDAMFLPTNPDSAYQNRFHFIDAKQKNLAETEAISPTLMRVLPSNKNSYKIGVDAPRNVIASVKDGVAFVQKAGHPEGDYPDGALGAGFGVELYNNVAPAYNELELLSPLRVYHANENTQKMGTSFTYSLRWSLYRLPSPDAKDARVGKLMEDIFALE